MSRYQEVKDKALHYRSSINILKIIGFEIEKTIEDELDNLKRNIYAEKVSFNRQSRLKSLDEKEQRQKEIELRNKYKNETIPALYKESTERTVERFRLILQAYYGRIIGLDLYDNERFRREVNEYVYQSISKVSKPYQIDQSKPYQINPDSYWDTDEKKFYRNYLSNVQMKLLEIATKLKIADPEITNEYINEAITSDPNSAKKYLSQLLNLSNAGLTEEDRDKYSSMYYHKILVPFVQENAGKNPTAARREIEALIKPENKILTERFKKYSEEFLPYLEEFKLDFENPESEKKAREEVGTFDLFTAKAKIYIKVAEQYDRENNYKMADQTIKTLEDKLKEYTK